MMRLLGRLVTWSLAGVLFFNASAWGSIYACGCGETGHALMERSCAGLSLACEDCASGEDRETSDDGCTDDHGAPTRCPGPSDCPCQGSCTSCGGLHCMAILSAWKPAQSFPSVFVSADAFCGYHFLLCAELLRPPAA